MQDNRPAMGGGCGGGRTGKICEQSNLVTNCNVIVTKKEIAIIERHLENIDTLDVCLNKIALERLKTGEATINDMCFVQHELLEADLVSRGITQPVAHDMALEQLGP
ncbi:hypothetical protein KKA53_03800 [Candidatus Dependentiae bacterium]|nr:hypothetical protein [Candidatus Dependentiae bacterium]